MNQFLALLVNALLAALPIGALLWVRRGQPEEPPRLSVGRFFLAYALLFSLLLQLTGWLGLAASLFAIGFLLGVLGTGRLVRPIYTALYGRAWLARFPDAPKRDSERWHLPLLIQGVLCFVAAMLAALWIG
jgi:hypothetical protein